MDKKEDKKAAGLLSMVFKIIGKDNINAGASGLIQSAINFKEGYKLEEGEAEVIGVLMEQDGEVFIMTATIDENNKMLRFENKHPATDLIEIFLNPKK